MTLEQVIEDIQRLRENDSLSSKVERQAIENILKSFARTIVEQSVPEELKHVQGEDRDDAFLVDGFNNARSQTLSNADNLLK